MDDIIIESPFGKRKESITIEKDILFELHNTLRKQQSVFETTGGIHAAALFNGSGNLQLVREDIGRHNALDKIIGNSLMNEKLPLQQSILLLSGRASFELIQKAAMAGIAIVASVGAPSSMAVSMARDSGITLIGFLRDNRFNIYTEFDKITINETALKG
jgi:FdhD protein